MRMLSENWELDDGDIIKGVHPIGVCEERVCVIHSPTEHHMSGWRQLYRDDRNIFERICEHGIGHPDPDQFEYWDKADMEFEGVHGCDGCCAPPRVERSDPSVNTPGIVGSNHPATSKAAAYRPELNTGTQRLQVLNMLKAHPAGLTDADISSRSGLPLNSVRPRRGELIEMHWIEDSGKTKTLHSGLQGIVWRYIPS